MANVSVSPVSPCQTSTSDLVTWSVKWHYCIPVPPSLHQYLSLSLSLSLSLCASVCLCHFLVDVTLYFLDRKNHQCKVIYTTLHARQLIVPTCTSLTHKHSTLNKLFVGNTVWLSREMYSAIQKSNTLFIFGSTKPISTIFRKYLQPATDYKLINMSCTTNYK